MNRPRLKSRAKNDPSLPIIIAGAIVVAVAFISALLLIASCSARISTTLGTGGDAHVSVRAEVPSALAAKLRKLAQAGGAAAPSGPLFDLSAIRKSLAARPGIELLELSQPDIDSVSVEARARSIEELAASPDIQSANLIKISHGPGWTECRVRLDRGNAKAASSIFPSIDPYLIEALSPPSLDEDPITAPQYRTMLKSVLGEKAMASMEAATISVSLGAPGPVISSGGGRLSGSTLTATIPIIDALVLDKPFELWLRWNSK